MSKKLFIGVLLAIFLCVSTMILSILSSFVISNGLLHFFIEQITQIILPTTILAGFLIVSNNKQLKTLFRADIAFVIGSILILLFEIHNGLDLHSGVTYYKYLSSLFLFRLLGVYGLMAVEFVKSNANYV
ncbi:hypothetical protein Metvu_0612 [Methanocaldococcus vulcanius M7]|uniref:Uncharacterized protein n=1 Tax=Methanocaldococcus vulcanius (strain ATCC 700851 / DSM 12094 / M7) TaxID=579137 RepID=C9RFW9_METVM|nr:hypothetical protein [Methanocaldococcus vulcanius]ACX72471.1 hypothetical protein Metvu_0612 [Methanocaldococcus vulcanius M7]